FLGAPRGELHPDALRELLHRLDVAEPGVLHQEPDRVAVRAAAEAVVELLRLAHRERGRLLAVERAQPDPVRAALLQRHPARDDGDDVDAVEQIVLAEAWDDSVSA